MKGIQSCNFLLYVHKENVQQKQAHKMDVSRWWNNNIAANYSAQ